MNAINFNFITNNVKGLQLSKKRLKLFEYFRDKLSSNGILFLQETHSTINNELKWKDEFKGALFFPMENLILVVFSLAFLEINPLLLFTNSQIKMVGS